MLVASLFAACGSSPEGESRDEDDPGSPGEPGPDGGIGISTAGAGGALVVYEGDEAKCLESGKCFYAVVDPAPTCGDGKVNVDREECDDGNRTTADGCSGICKVEPFFTCPSGGGACKFDLECGNGKLEPGESCDDGDTDNEDGCSGDCLTVEAGYYCPPGQDCQLLQDCGDGARQTGEQCDDGARSTPGCDENCQLEPGYRCLVPGAACEEVPVCGDGKKDSGEQCDDGSQCSDDTACTKNADCAGIGDAECRPRSGDGCNDVCLVEASWYDCSAVGEPCTSTVQCGDGKLEAAETCDTGAASSQGCDDCQVVDGWICPKAGAKCFPECGDAKLRGAETCDDGNATSGDGCSSTCQVEAGYGCSGLPSNCSKSVCGNGAIEGSEACDAGNENGVFFGDGSGCTNFCTAEPICRASGTTQPCKGTCGDGMILGAEECDDGNTSNNDGCSAQCEVETGFACQTETFSDTQPCSYDASKQCLVLPVIYRDFEPADYGSDGAGGAGNNTGHDDFVLRSFYKSNGVQWPMGGYVLCTDMVDGTLGADGRPMLLSSYDGCDSMGDYYAITSDSSFDDWYDDGHPANATFARSLELEVQGDGSFQFGSTNFYPLDGLGAGDEYCSTWDYLGYQPIGSSPCPTATHNYHFTSEVRYVFRYQGGEKLSFFGDDDVWVFVNGQKVVDLGGIHGQIAGDVDLDTLSLSSGELYEIVVFQAERHPTGSNYQLTLAGFDVTRTTSCDDVCGDGEVSALEQCDDGTNDGSYGGCDQVGGQCVYGPFCGDGGVDAPQEVCDDGSNTTVAYGAEGCAPGCQEPPRCGDGELDPGEQCDSGSANSDSGRDGCRTDCMLQPYCGDGTVDAAEECDSGANLGGYAQCKSDCTWDVRCGDGAVQSQYGELCDDGPANGSAGSTCSTTCGLDPICGDGIVTTPETCDDTVNDGSYGGCTSSCQNAPSCGDGVVQSEHGEECDFAEGNAEGELVEYGGCTATCQLGPRCGDGKVQQSTSEECDDGNNTSGDGCSQNCQTEQVVVK